ncbi:DUF167 domain-containing protein [Patescibacteria group bacterium]|nr:DUF167 domain-containing protein [Patescibacteria group bacterium]
MLLKVKVIANSHRPGLVKMEGDILHIKLAAPPADGKANAELCETLSRVLKVPKTDVIIKRGQGSKVKYLEILGFDDSHIFAILSQRLSSAKKLRG